MDDTELVNLILDAGFTVFPLYKDKRPMIAGGYKGASRDKAVIKSWLNNPDRRLWGIPAEPNGFFAVDIDPDGIDTWTSWYFEHNTQLETPSQKTPRGGKHYLFKYPDDMQVPNNAGKLATGIDLRSAGYIATGRGYEWIDPITTPLADAPAWLLEKIRDMQKVKTTEPILLSQNEQIRVDIGQFYLNKYLALATIGTRNQYGFELACQLRDNGLTITEAENWMVNYAYGVPQSPVDAYTEDEAILSLREAYSRGPRQPSTLPKVAQEKPVQPTSQEPPPQEPPPPQPKQNQRKTSWTLTELYNTEFPDPNWIVPGIIQEGLVMLAGRPKVGKSWLLLQIAYGVATGGKLFGKDITQGEVLYLALEDNARRIKDRSRKMSIPTGAPIQFEFTWKPLHNGGLDQLLIACETGKYRLIIIDTLARSLPGINHNDENPIGPIMDSMQSMAMDHGMTILTADHTRKANGFFIDPIDDIMGNTSKSRALDSVLAIYKEQGKAGAVLRGRGRETEEIDLALLWDPITACWQSQGPADGVRMTEAYEQIITYLAESGKSQVGSIANGLGKDRGNTFRHLQDLVNAGKLRKESIENKVYYENIQK